MSTPRFTWIVRDAGTCRVIVEVTGEEIAIAGRDLLVQRHGGAGRRVASPDWHLEVWDLDRGTMVRASASRYFAVVRPEPITSSRYLETRTSDVGARVREVESGAVVAELGAVDDADISGDGRLVATANDGRVQVWHLP